MSYSEGYSFTTEDKQLNNELEVDWDLGTFKVTVTGYNYIRKALGLKLSASKFAESYNFGYKTISINSDKSKGITGSIPEEYVADSENTQNSAGKGKFLNLL